MTYWARFAPTRSHGSYRERINVDLARDPREIAASLGLRCDVPGHDELFVDIDGWWAWWRFRRHCNVLFAVMADARCPMVRHVTPSRHWRVWWPRYHARIEFPRTLSDIERVAWQAALGSDPMRELLSLLRIEKAIAPATVFFERHEPPCSRGIQLPERE